MTTQGVLDPIGPTRNPVLVLIIRVGCAHDVRLRDCLEQTGAENRRGEPRRDRDIDFERPVGEVIELVDRSAEAEGLAVVVVSRLFDVETKHRAFGGHSKDRFVLELAAVHRMRCAHPILDDSEPEQEPELAGFGAPPAVAEMA